MTAAHPPGGFGPELVRLMADRGVGVRELARALYVNPSHVSNIRAGRARPSAELARLIDDQLSAGGSLVALAAAPAAAGQLADDEIAAIELGRRALASDVGDGTCERIETAVDQLAVAYPRTPPAGLLPRVRSHLGYVTTLLDARSTLSQRRRLLVSGGWLSLLAATVLTDLHDMPAAASYLRTAEQLAAETDHAEIRAWTLETRAWIAVTQGGYRAALELARSAREAAPRGSSPYYQATAQEGRAWALLGDQARAGKAVARLETLASPLRQPDQPEHHYRYDPAKAEAYVGTTLAWAGDPAAEQIARQLVAGFEAPAEGMPRYRRATAARLDLALALTRRGQLDEAAGTALAAVTSGYLVPSNYWRAERIVAATAGDVPEGRDLAEAYQAEVEAAREPADAGQARALT